MPDVENSIPPIASGKLFPWYLCLMYVYAFGEKHFCVENFIPPIASGKLFPWYLCLMYVYAFGEKHFCMFNANKVFVLYCILATVSPSVALWCSQLCNGTMEVFFSFNPLLTNLVL